MKGNLEEIENVPCLSEISVAMSYQLTFCDVV
jgi:hypothetical protein